MPARARKVSRDPSKQVDAIFSEFQGNVPGASVLVVQRGKVVLKKSYGLADRENSIKASPKTNYRLASVSKQFTATAILLLVERRKLSLEDDLLQFFPDFPEYGKEIRVRHLLNHTSGLLAYEDLIPESRKEPVVDGDVLDILKNTDRTYFAPGEKFRYSNSGYALLACIVEKVAGIGYPAFLKVNLFQPLGMRGTFLTQRGYTMGSHRAFGYSKKGETFERTDQSMTSFVLGDGGIYSSLDDLVKWERALASARLLKKATLDEMMTGTVKADEVGASYGYGWYVGKHGEDKAVWHGGSTIGFRNHYLRIPGQSLTVVVLTNRNNADAAALARKVADIFLR